MQRMLRETGFSVIMIDLKQDWTERPIMGRNYLVAAIRYPLMWLARRLGLPYEIMVLAEPQ